MKFPAYTIELSSADVTLCRKAAPLWGDVPSVSVGANKFKKPEWTRVMMSLLQMTFKAGPNQRPASDLASRIYEATESGKGCVVTEVEEPDPVPVKAVKESQGSLAFD